MKILYIHGFNGTPEGAKLDMLRNHYRKAEIIAPQHDSRAKNVFPLLDEVASNMDGDDDVILGNSLGGFWANFFSLRYGLGAVLVNPVVRPSQSLQKLGYPLASEYLEFENQISATDISPRIVLLAEDDELLNYRDAYEYYSPICQVETRATGGHRMNDPESLDQMHASLTHIVNTTCCWGISNDDD